MNKKTIIISLAGLTGLLVVARMSGKKESEVEASDIPEMPKPGEKKAGQKTLRGQYLNFLKELKELGYFVDESVHYTFLLDQAIAWKDDDLKTQIKRMLSSMMYSKDWFEEGKGNFKPSSEKDVKASIQRFSRENNINLEPSIVTEPSEYETLFENITKTLTSGFRFGKRNRFGNKVPLWRQLRTLRMKKCPYAVGENNV